MELPITAMLEKRQSEYTDSAAAIPVKLEMSEVISKVRTLEEAQQKKAKEEERDRILEILKITHFRSYQDEQEAITRINL